MNAAVYSCFNISLFFRLHRSIMLINCKFLIAYLLVFYFSIYFSQPFNASCAQMSAVQQSIFPFRIALDHTCGWWTLITRSNNTQAKPITAQRKWITIKTHTRTYIRSICIFYQSSSLSGDAKVIRPSVEETACWRNSYVYDVVFVRFHLPGPIPCLCAASLSTKKDMCIYMDEVRPLN